MPAPESMVGQRQRFVPNAAVTIAIKEKTAHPAEGQLGLQTARGKSLGLKKQTNARIQQANAIDAAARLTRVMTRVL